jgi:hypothetical protein
MAAGRQACRRLARSSNVRHPLLANPSSSVLARKYRRRQSQSLRPLVRAFSALDLNGSPGTRRISTIVTQRSKCARISPFDRRCGTHRLSQRPLHLYRSIIPWSRPVHSGQMITKPKSSRFCKTCTTDFLNIHPLLYRSSLRPSLS